MKTNAAKVLFVIIAAWSLSPWGNSALALFLGIVLASTLGNPFIDFTKKNTSNLLQLSVIGLGAGMNLLVVGRVGASGIGYTISGILFTGLVAFLLAKLLQTPKILSMLIAVGTAICGGSAIAATGPVIDADNESMSVSLGVVFIFNAVALFIFPPIGHYMNLTEHQFGLWAALAIHDTSSVVGASMQYGAQALELATTVKLARALWIIPVSLAFAFFMKNENKKQIKIPWFIFGFILMAALITWVPALSDVGHVISTIAKRLLILTLFFIGTNLNMASVKKVGLRPLLLGLFLWIIVGSATLAAIKFNWII